MSRRGNFSGNNRGRNWNQNKGSHFSGDAGGGPGWSRDEHDDRDRKPRNSLRQVTFKTGTAYNRGGMKHRNLQFAVKARLEDDEEMVDFGGNKAFYQNQKKNRRKGSPIPKRLPTSSSGWFLVTIPYGYKYEKDAIIQHLRNAISPEIFIPHYWKVEKDCVTFYVDELKVAERLLGVNREIQMPDGFKLGVRVRGSVPTVNIDAGVRERMKLAMAKRYDAGVKALNLTKFHADPDLQDIFCALFRPTIMLTAIDIIAANIPDLVALNLNDNKIHLLDHFKCMAEKLPNLKILHLANNRIPSSVALLPLRNIPLVEIKLDGNPFKDRYKSVSLYKSDMRRKFPKLRKLDDIELEPEIGFDVAETTTLPPAKGSFLCDAAGAVIVRQFIEQYFVIFDSANRQPLLDAYHENAMVSLSAANSTQQGPRLSQYYDWNRNLLRMAGDKSRQVRYGRLPAVSFLSEMPNTQHDPQSFSVDLTLFTPKLINFVVTGVFRELPKKEPYNSSESQSNASKILRSFQRIFMIVPSGGGFCIRNEMIYISNPTPAQSKTAFKPRTVNPTPAPTQSVPVATMPVADVVPQHTIDQNTKLQMVHAMSTQSNMNIEWSKKCLDETNWDYNHAIAVFTELHKQGKIPPEAFVK